MILDTCCFICLMYTDVIMEHQSPVIQSTCVGPDRSMFIVIPSKWGGSQQHVSLLQFVHASSDCYYSWNAWWSLYVLTLIITKKWEVFLVSSGIKVGTLTSIYIYIYTYTYINMDGCTPTHKLNQNRESSIICVA